MKKVLFVINTLGTGGAEKSLISLLKRLHTKYDDLSIDLYVLMDCGELSIELPDYVNLLNDNYDSAPIYSEEGNRQLKRHVRRKLFKRGAFFVTLPYMIKNFVVMLLRGRLNIDKLLWRTMAKGSIVNNYEYDLAVAFIEGGAAYYVAEEIKAKKKAVFIHTDYYETGYYPSLDCYCYEKFDKVFAVSNEVRDTFLKAYPSLSKKTELFSNIIDLDEILEKSNETKDPFWAFDNPKDDVIRIISIGRLHKLKTIEYAIDAMVLLKQKNYPIKWYVLGEGAHRKALEKKIRMNGLVNDFILVGNQSNPYPFIKNCNLVVHTSRYEGKSVAIGEAMALGKAVILTDCKGNREQIINRTNGMLCDYSAKGVAVAIETLLNNESLRLELETNAAEKMKKEMSVDDTQKLISLLA